MSGILFFSFVSCEPLNQAQTMHPHLLLRFVMKYIIIALPLQEHYHSDKLLTL